MTETLTKSQQVATDVTALLRARNPLLWIKTGEEARVEGYLTNAASAAKYATNTWDVAQGALDGEGSAIEGDTFDIGAALNVIKTTSGNEEAKRAVWILRDAPVWLQGPAGASPLRQLRNLARSLPSVPRDNAQSIIILTTSGEVPPELAAHATVIEWPLPDRAEIAAILDATVANLPEGIERPNNGVREAAIDAAVGLSSLEAEACYSKSLVQLHKIDPQTVAQEKRRVITREGVLEWFDPLPGGLDAVGGLENLKGWLGVRKNAYTKEAREYGLPAPKGTVLVGVQGCGKSLSAKAIATAWGVPLLRLDLGALKSKFVGESEGNLRKALKVVEAIGRCVLWIDEIEKALQGATSGSSDGGVSTDALGTLLSWSQERAGGAFIVATANDVSVLPPELLRKGRFDEIFFVDTPNENERPQVLKAALKANGRKDVKIDFAALTKATDGFTGAEIAELVPTALYAGFNDGAREITTEDLLEACRTVVKLTTTYAEKVKALRDWARERARPASAEVKVQKAASKGRELDVG